MKKIIIVGLAVLTLSISAFAADQESNSQNTVDTSHNPVTGKTTTTRKHKKHTKAKGHKAKDTETTTSTTK